MRDLLLHDFRLGELWNRIDQRYFNYRLRQNPTKVRFGAPAVAGAPGTYATRPHGWAPEVVIDEHLARLPHTPWRLVEDLLIHEACHQIVHRAGRPASDNAAHRGSFAVLAQHVGNKLGLPPATGRWDEWPSCVRPDGYYLDNDD